jgi:hypothetical protein
MKKTAVLLVLGLALLPGQSQALVHEGDPRSTEQNIEEEGPLTVRSPEWRTLYTAYVMVPKTRVNPVAQAFFTTAFRCAGEGSCHLRLVLGDAQKKAAVGGGQVVEGNRIFIERSSDFVPLPGPGLYEVRTEIKSPHARFKEFSWDLDIFNFDGV